MQKISDKKNILNKILIIMTIMIISITGVSADFTAPASIILGSTSQARETIAITPVTIANTDAVNPITNLNAVFTSNIAGFVNTDFNVTMTGAPILLPPLNSTTVSIQGFVPRTFVSGQKQIGSLIVTGVSGGVTISKTIPVFMETISNLKVKRVTSTIDGEEERISEGESVKVKRGQNVALEIEVENLFSTSSDITINDVNVNIDNNNLDIDEDESLGDLGADDTDTASFSFDIPRDADDGKETITVTVDGEDDNRAIHKMVFQFQLDVEVKSSEIQINSITPPSSGFCTGQTSTMNIEIENTGLKDLTKAIVIIKSSDINFNKKIDSIIINEGSRKTLSVQIPITETMPVGTYFADIEAYYQDSSTAKTDTETATINVRKCQPAVIPTTTTTTTTTIPASNTSFEVVPQGPTSGAAFGVPVTRKSFSSDWTNIALLIAACVIVGLLIVLLLRMGKSYY